MSVTRVARSKADLTKELSDQVALLVHACQSFDKGLRPVGKHIALSLRVLLHHHGKSRALLEQLGLRDKRFIDTAGDLNPRNLLTECPLCIMRATTAAAGFLPLCLAGEGPRPARWIPFAEWWNNPVIRDAKGQSFNRRELVLNVADTDGGAHVDPDLDEAYMALSRQNSLAWVFIAESGSTPLGGPELECVRQIAHELLETLKQKASNEVAVPYAG